MKVNVILLWFVIVAILLVSGFQTLRELDIISYYDNYCEDNGFDYYINDGWFEDNKKCVKFCGYDNDTNEMVIIKKTINEIQDSDINLVLCQR